MRAPTVYPPPGCRRSVREAVTIADSIGVDAAGRWAASPAGGRSARPWSCRCPGARRTRPASRPRRQASRRRSRCTRSHPGRAPGSRCRRALDDDDGRRERLRLVGAPVAASEHLDVALPQDPRGGRPDAQRAVPAQLTALVAAIAVEPAVTALDGEGDGSGQARRARCRARMPTNTSTTRTAAHTAMMVDGVHGAAVTFGSDFVRRWHANRDNARLRAAASSGPLSGSAVSSAFFARATSMSSAISACSASTDTPSCGRTGSRRGRRR